MSDELAFDCANNFTVKYKDGEPSTIEHSDVGRGQTIRFKMDGSTAVLQDLKAEVVDRSEDYGLVDIEHVRAVAQAVEELPFVQAVKGV